MHTQQHTMQPKATKPHTGFDINPIAIGSTEAKGSNVSSQNNPGWFLTFKERVGEPVFGADEERNLDSLQKWDDLAWSDLISSTNLNFVNTLSNIPLANTAPVEDRAIIWGSNSSDLAYALFQKPSRVLIHSNDMIC